MRMLLAAGALVIASTGTAFAEPRNLAGFTRVDASSATKVEVTVGPNFSVDVSGPGAERIVTRVSGDTLLVHHRSGWNWGPMRPSLVRVTMPRVEGLSASSAADLTVSGVNGGNISLDSSSAGELRVAGRCTSFEADVSSGAEIYAEGLQCENGNVDASSGGDARVFASGRLNVDASSGGGVLAHGNPNIGNVSLSSGGWLRRAN